MKYNVYQCCPSQSTTLVFITTINGTTTITTYEYNNTRKQSRLTAKLSAKSVALCSKRFRSEINASFCCFIFSFSSSRATHHTSKPITAMQTPQAMF